MSKRFFAVIIALVFVFILTMPGAVGCQNLVDVDQIGAINDVDVYQAGANQNIDIYQTTTGNNNAYVDQDGGLNNNVVIEQLTTGGNNYVEVDQEDSVAAANNKSVTINQIAETGNNAEVDQYGAGDDTVLLINQTATSTYNNADINQDGPAALGSNTVINQMGTFNDLYVEEDLDSLGESNTYLDQVANGSNIAHIEADTDSAGPNLLTEADTAGVVGSAPGAALQNSVGSYNDFTWFCDGGNSEFGLSQTAIDDNYAYVQQLDGGNSAGIYQDAGLNNYADIYQYGGGNSLEASQIALGGFNELTVEQAGGMNATVTQNAASGNNTATVTQL